MKTLQKALGQKTSAKKVTKKSLSIENNVVVDEYQQAFNQWKLEQQKIDDRRERHNEREAKKDSLKVYESTKIIYQLGFNDFATLKETCFDDICINGYNMNNLQLFATLVQYRLNNGINKIKKVRLEGGEYIQAVRETGATKIKYIENNINVENFPVNDENQKTEVLTLLSEFTVMERLSHNAYNSIYVKLCECIDKLPKFESIQEFNGAIKYAGVLTWYDVKKALIENNKLTKKKDIIVVEFENSDDNLLQTRDVYFNMIKQYGLENLSSNQQNSLLLLSYGYTMDEITKILGMAKKSIIEAKKALAIACNIQYKAKGIK